MELELLQQRFQGYSLYFNDRIPRFTFLQRKLAAIQQFLTSKALDVTKIIQEECYEVQIQEVARNGRFISLWPDILTGIENSALDVSCLWGIVLHKIIHSRINEGQTISSQIQDIPRIQVALMRYEPVTPLANINSTHVGKFVTVRGTVVRTGPVKPLCALIKFVCASCRGEFCVDQPRGVHTVPQKCEATPNCKGKIFRPQDLSERTKFVDFKSIRLQDVPGSNVADVPRMIDCDLLHSLVKTCKNGDVVTMTGVIKINRDIGTSLGQLGLHTIYIEIIGIKHHKNCRSTMGGHWFSFSRIDYCAIGEIHDKENLFKLLVASFCPSIFGHELVKAALILSLFGGRHAKVESLLSRRDDINILMMGDPGIGKSQLLKTVAEIAPRCVYVSGTASTVAGLTVTLVKEGDGYAVEAGALVMSDGGTCCIDELDKVPVLHTALLEAMEQQTVSVCKAGTYRTFPARANIIAAANPVDGHYDKRKSFEENIKISAPLLSRFDIAFLMLDIPNEVFDRKLVDHVMGVNPRRTSIPGSPDRCLRDALKVRSWEKLDIIPHHLIRKYIAYARRYVHPELSPEARDAIKTYFLRLRVRRQKVKNCSPVTTRQLESLVRLTEARAKLELREIATLQDAEDILEIFDSGLCSIFDDSILDFIPDVIDPPLSPRPGPSGVNYQAKQLYKALEKISFERNKNLFTLHEMEMARAKGRLMATIETLVQILNDQGKLLKKAGQTYELSD